MLKPSAGAILSGLAAGAILGFAGGSLLLAGRAQDQRTPPIGLTLATTALGGLAGLMRRRPPVPSVAGAWHPLRVARTIRESEEVMSFVLMAPDGSPLVPYQPGQHLPIRLHIPGIAKPVVRTYSLSDYPAPAGRPSHYRLSVKREPAPKGQPVPPGLASGYLHDHVSAGAMVEARDPAGGFVLDVHGHRPAVLISNGIGITPMVAMAKAAAVHHRPGPVWFIHGSRNGRYHVLREEIVQLVASFPALQHHIVYSRPEPGDVGNYHSEGHLDATLVCRLVPADADYYICGSPVFLEAMLSGLKKLGVPESSLFFEMFGGPGPMAAQTPTMGRTSAEVVFARSDLRAVWSEADGTLLEFAEAQGLEPPSSCRAGVCGTCACRLLDGEVDTTVAPTATVPEGHGLLCISRPRSKRITLDL